MIDPTRAMNIFSVFLNDLFEKGDTILLEATEKGEITLLSISKENAQYTLYLEADKVFFRVDKPLYTETLEIGTRKLIYQGGQLQTNNLDLVESYKKIMGYAMCMNS